MQIKVHHEQMTVPNTGDISIEIFESFLVAEMAAGRHQLQSPGKVGLARGK